MLQMSFPKKNKLYVFDRGPYKYESKYLRLKQNYKHRKAN